MNDATAASGRSDVAMTYRFGFMMDQIAGHVTNYRNLRRVAEQEPDLDAHWSELHYYREGGSIERIRERLPIIPSYLSGNARGAYELRKGLRCGPFDAIFSNASVGVFFGRRFQRTPTMLDFDSTPLQRDRMEAYTLKADPEPIAKVKYALARHMFRSAARLHAWSRWAKQGVVDEYGIRPDRVVVNPPGIDLDFWRPGPTAGHSADDGPRRVLFVGGDFRRKGGPLLLEWFASQPSGAVELHVVTREPVTSGPGVVVYRDLTPNSPQLLALYQSSDVFVLPSLGECFGIATVEAMGAGLPVIATDVGGVADIIDHGENGYLVEPGSAASLTEALSAVFASPTRSADLGRRSRAIAEERFDVNRNARRTLDHLRELADRGRGH